MADPPQPPKKIEVPMSIKQRSVMSEQHTFENSSVGSHIFIEVPTRNLPLAEILPTGKTYVLSSPDITYIPTGVSRIGDYDLPKKKVKRETKPKLVTEQAEV